LDKGVIEFTATASSDIRLYIIHEWDYNTEPDIEMSAINFIKNLIGE
jgi:hypothetical protein